MAGVGRDGRLSERSRKCREMSWSQVIRQLRNDNINAVGHRHCSNMASVAQRACLPFSRRNSCVIFVRHSCRFLASKFSSNLTPLILLLKAPCLIISYSVCDIVGLFNFTARRYASAVYVMALCLSLQCLLQIGVLLKPILHCVIRKFG